MFPVTRLVDDAFCAIVVADVRDEHGNLIGLPLLTVQAAFAAGLNLYNEEILINEAGTLPQRAPKHFENSRKLGKQHQNVLIFLKGDALRATEKVGPCEFGDDGVPDDPKAGLEVGGDAKAG
jgi:hypothetical protein